MFEEHGEGSLAIRLLTHNLGVCTFKSQSHAAVEHGTCMYIFGGADRTYVSFLLLLRGVMCVLSF